MRYIYLSPTINYIMYNHYIRFLRLFFCSHVTLRERESEWWKIARNFTWRKSFSSSASLGYRVKTWKPAIGDDKKFSWTSSRWPRDWCVCQFLRSPNNFVPSRIGRGEFAARRGRLGKTLKIAVGDIRFFFLSLLFLIARIWHGASHKPTFN